MKIKFLIFFIYIYCISSRTLFEQISLQENLTPSKYITYFLEKDINKHVEYGRTEDTKLSEYNYIKETNKNNKVLIDLPRTVGSYLESLEFYIENMSKENKTLLTGREYKYNMTYAETLITTYPKPLVVSSKENDVNFQFNLIQPNLKVQFKESSINDLSDIISIKNIILGINRNTKILNIFEFQNEKFKYKSMNEINLFIDINYDLQSHQLKKLLIDSNTDKSDDTHHIMMIDTEKRVLIFKTRKMSHEADNELPKFSLDIVTIFNDDRLEKQEIVQFATSKGIVYIGFDNGIIIRDTGKELNKFESVVGIAELKVLDLQLIHDALYVLIKDYGIKVLDISNHLAVAWGDFEMLHSSAHKLSVHFNPYYDYPFLGVLVNNRMAQQTEFFFEMSLMDEFSPKLYRLYMSDKYYDIRHIVTDDEFTYLLDHNSNSLLILSRSVTATSRNSVYKFQIKELLNKEVVFPGIIFSDQTYVHQHLGIFSNGLFIYTEKVELDNAKLEVEFYKNGNYLFEFFTYSDFCNFKKDVVKMCRTHVNYNFIVGETNSDFTIKILIVIAIVIIVLFIFAFLIGMKKLKAWIFRGQYVVHYGDDKELQTNVSQSSAASSSNMQMSNL